ncbi:MAG: hypothetical protein EA424_01355 [Planctomycetaceae bacterium]|nr:MAG: hypothetical protein EA424_01355 [Planctomycetaceae bacterium]
MGKQRWKVRLAISQFPGGFGLHNRAGRSTLACGLIAVALLLGGCAAWGRPVASEPPVAEDKAGFSGLRPAGKQGQALGLDERSREIERSLGVH